MEALVKKFERLIILTVVAMMALVLVLATVELGWLIVKDMISEPVLLLEIEELLDIFGMFMLVLIGVELLETIVKTYLHKSVNHGEIVLSVAIIAIARKVIILDPKELSSGTLLGIAAIILALCGGKYLLWAARRRRNPAAAGEA